MTSVLQKISVYFRMVKFAHSVFALPFAFTAAIIAASGIPTINQIFWIAVAMVGGRSGAMGLNRIIDRHIDQSNPRTASRELPKGIIGVRETGVFVMISFGFMILAAYMLNPLCLKLSPVALVILFLYSYTKRFTWASHFFLGIAISAAPIGAWIAVRGTFDIKILVLGFAVIFWLAGFDILYALQDRVFDKKYGLYSIPQTFGVRNSLWLSRLFHFITFIFLMVNAFVFGLGGFYWAGLFLVAGLFFYEHSMVSENDLSKLDMAFFNMNGYISITVFLFTLMDFII